MASNSNNGKVTIRPAVIEDCEEIMRLNEELAEFEKMADQVKINAETLRKDCFGETPRCHFIVAEHTTKDSKECVGYTLYFNIYSTWEGLAMHLEDIYVTPAFRGQGIGKRLWMEVTKITYEMGCSRLHLAVLGWNTFAKDWYTRIGCIDLTVKEDWHLMRLTRDGMEKYLKSQNV